jgi:hypothetical protein
MGLPLPLLGFKYAPLQREVLKMGVRMTLRWFGEGHDNIPLAHMRQVPGIHGIAATLMDIPAGEAWPDQPILAMKNRVEAAGLAMEVIESVNVQDRRHLSAAEPSAARDQDLLDISPAWLTTLQPFQPPGLAENRLRPGVLILR